VTPAVEKGYALFKRTWRKGDVLTVSFPMPIRRIIADERIKDDAGRVALQRGPVVYCAEAVDNGADGISLINTVFGTAWDPVRRKPIITGGLSGPAIKPFALYCVNRIRDLGVPVIGMGGIMTGRDAFEFLLCGASAVAVGSALIRDPYSPLAIIKELDGFIKRHEESK